MYRVRDDGEHGMDGGDRQGSRAMAIDYRTGITPRHDGCRSAVLGPSGHSADPDAALLPTSRLVTPDRLQVPDDRVTLDTFMLGDNAKD